MKKLYIVLFLLVLCAFFPACKTEEELDPITITLTGNVVSFNEVEGATKYKVFVGLNSYETTSTTYEITETNYGTYEVYVVACNDKKESAESNHLIYIVEKKLTLEAPTITLVEDVIKISNVENAKSYEVNINGVAYNTTNLVYDLKGLENGTYTIYVKAINANVKSEKSNEVTYTVNNTVSFLDAPVITYENGVLSWSKVDNATSYYIYVDYELIDITNELSYALDVTAGNHLVYVRSVSENNEYPSGRSNELKINSAIQATPFDFNKPFVMFNMNKLDVPSFNSENMMVHGSKFVSKDDFDMAFVLIKVGDNYKIKADNGLFLTHRRYEGSDRFFLEARDEINNQLFKIANANNDPFVFTIIPMSNASYLLCDDNASGYHQYMEMKDDKGNINIAQVFTFFNVECTIADDVVKESGGEEDPTLDLTKPLVIYNLESNKIFSFNGEGLLVQGTVYEVSGDYTSTYFKLEASGDKYLIKFNDGTYLTHTKIDSKDRFIKAAYTGDNTQKFILTVDGDVYKIEPVSNAGYLLCQDDAGGYHQYSDCNAASQKFVLVNVEVEEPCVN